ncbi:unnamed protein product [Effrenium voratum]|uniref:Carbonic anhydrase n=1 Tax=Effrenium voratum TaxID=2562239 RepID=A0AA36IMC6_9DINO|nr:unnamed protein product [Effrenium voratum]
MAANGAYAVQQRPAYPTYPTYPQTVMSPGQANGLPGYRVMPSTTPVQSGSQVIRPARISQVSNGVHAVPAASGVYSQRPSSAILSAASSPSAKTQPTSPSRKVRMVGDAPLPPQEALRLLKEGNQRFARGEARAARGQNIHQEQMQLDRAGEAPHTAVIGCADMRAPVDTVFDALPGDLFVLRNVGNTCSSAECSMIGSLEFCVNAINTRNIMVIGHKHCGAIKKATQALLHPHQQEEQVSKSLNVLLKRLSHIASKAVAELGTSADEEAIVSHAVKMTNVFHTIDSVLKHSSFLRVKVQKGEVEVHGGLFDFQTGQVEFLGPSPQQANIVKKWATAENLDA